MKKYILIISLLTLIIIALLPPYSVYVHAMDTTQKTNISRDIQLLLSLKGKYKGPIDGICGKLTKDAIDEYDKTLLNTPHVTTCSSALKDKLNSEIRAIITTSEAKSTESTEDKSTDTSKDAITPLKSRVEELDKKINNAQSTITRLRDSFSSYFVTQFNNLASMGVSAFVTAISISIAVIALIGNVLLKDAVKAAHDREIEKTQTTIADMMNIASAEIGADIFATLGGHCIDLYKDFRDPVNRNKDLYKSYVSMAASIATVGRKYGVVLQKSLENKKIVPETIKEREKREFQEEKMMVCLNNYVYYSAQNGNKCAVESVINDLIKTAADRKAKGYQDWYSLEDTIAWAKLHTGLYTVTQTKNALQRLIDNPDISQQWKNETKKRYDDLYNKFHPNEDEQIVLTVPPLPV